MVKYSGENDESQQNNSKILLGARHFAMKKSIFWCQALCNKK